MNINTAIRRKILASGSPKSKQTIKAHAFGKSSSNFWSSYDHLKDIRWASGRKSSLSWSPDDQKIELSKIF